MGIQTHRHRQKVSQKSWNTDTDIRTFRYTDAQKYRHIDTQTYRCTEIKTHRNTDTDIRTHSRSHKQTLLLSRTRFWVPGGIRPVNSGLLEAKRKSSVLCDCNRDCECDKKAR